MICHLGLGSNLFNPEKQLDMAVAKIEALDGLRVLRASQKITTSPYGYIEQPDFCNLVLEIESLLPPEKLLQMLLDIELQMGRQRVIKWGPRVIDIDILLAEDLVLDNRDVAAREGIPELVIPHPDLQNRLFVLQPLLELIPDAIHPVLHKTIKELYYALSENGGNK